MKTICCGKTIKTVYSPFSILSIKSYICFCERQAPDGACREPKFLSRIPIKTYKKHIKTYIKLINTYKTAKAIYIKLYKHIKTS